MSTAENAKEIKDIINSIIDASINFEKLMDRIDFSSYFKEEEEDKYIIEEIGGGWTRFDTKSKDAYKCFNGVINGIDEEICKNMKDIYFEQDGLLGIQCLIYGLNKAKKIRLEAKQQIRKEEEKKYIDATHELQRIFDHIPEKYFNKQKDKSLIDSLNWAKILYFNELAICYSGLVKSSMSLGYAEQSISLLEELYPQLKKITKWDDEKLKKSKDELYKNLRELKKGEFKDFATQLEEKLHSKEETKDNNLLEFIVEFYHKLEKIKEWRKNDAWKEFNSQVKKSEESIPFIKVMKLYTFALYNRGEAERLLHNEDLAMHTFRRITEFSNFVKDTDNNSALLRMAEILINMGRGKEALKALDDVEVKEQNFQFVTRELERASIFIDRKEYREAYDTLKKFYITRWNHTFAQRKAKVYMLRLINEVKKNRIKDFQNAIEINNKLEENVKKENIARILVLEEVPKLAGNADVILGDLLKESIERQDGGNFKKICAYIAEYFNQEYKNNESIEDFKKALKYFYLYLFNEYYFNFDSDDISRKELTKEFAKEVIPIIKEKKREKLLKYAFKKNIDFCSLLSRVEDENYLEGFFYLYIEVLEDNKIDLSNIEKDIIKEIKDTLRDIYIQKDNMIELETIQEKYTIVLETEKESSVVNENKSVDFIKYFYFRNTLHNDDCIKNCMQPDSIAKQMQKNTEDFVKKVVRKSRFPLEGEKIIGRLCVLRRWNSFTPVLGSSLNPSKGGGYFLYFLTNKKSLGIVIDPGYDFLENFFSQGFGIADIDMILISHAHPDHTNDLPSILSLFHEMNDRLGGYSSFLQSNNRKTNKKTLTLVLSPGVFEQYNRIIKSSEKDLEDIFVVSVAKGAEPVTYRRKLDNNYNVEIQAFGTSHRDLSQFQGLGFKIIAQEGKTPKTIIGYTGDARWNLDEKNHWSNHFRGCNIICAHLGSIVNILDDKDLCNTFCTKYKKGQNGIICKNLKECKETGFSNVNINKTKLIKQVHEENHLYLAGLTFLFNSLLNEDNLKLGIISEFGEEFKYGIRMDLYKKFDAWFKQNNKKIKCLPGDIGLEVDVFTGKVYCHCCEKFVERSKIEPLTFTKEEAICFVCNECKTVLSPYQIGEKLKCYCENGRKLELADE